MTDAAANDALDHTAETTARPDIPQHRNPLGNLLRGALIGVVETVPGVSGGTVALVTGIYDELIDAGHHMTGAARRLLVGPDRLAGMREHLRAVNWVLVIPLVIGMAAAVLTVAGPVAGLVEDHPQTMRALFLGLVLGSVLVPVRLSGGSWRAPEYLRFGLGVIAGLAATSLPTTSLEPSLWIVAPRRRDRHLRARAARPFGIVSISCSAWASTSRPCRRWTSATCATSPGSGCGPAWAWS